jgi:hypothetical protein
MHPAPGDAPRPAAETPVPATSSGSRPPATPVYRERLFPGPAYLAGAAGVGIMFGLIVWIVSITWALATSIPLAIAFVIWIWFGSPEVVVEDSAEGPVLRAGRAWIPLDQVARPVVLDRAPLRELLGPSSDARAYTCERPWLHTAVRVDVTDPQDPTPYWVVETRTPDRLVAALRSGGVTD